MDYKDYLAGSSDENFWFKAKNNLLQILLSKIKIKNPKILSVGTGTGGELKVLNNFGEIWVLDLNKKALDLIPKELYKQKKVGDVQKLPFPKEFFDVVIASDIIEHVENDKKAIKEVRRVLKKGGALIFTVPAHQFLFSSHDKALGHKKRYSKKQLKDLTKAFNLTKLGYWNFFLSPLIVLKRFADKNAKPKVDQANFSKPIDKILYKIMKTENFLIKYDLPLVFGVTIFGICKK